MLDLKGLIAKMLSKMVVTSPSISIKATTGTLVSASVRKYGNVVQLTIQTRNSSSVAAGGNIFVGTINTVALRPIIYASSGSLYGGWAILGAVSAAGTITIRNNGNSAVTISGNNSATNSFTYIVAK